RSAVVVGDHCPLGEDGSLRYAGGAARVQQVSNIVRAVRTPVKRAVQCHLPSQFVDVLADVGAAKREDGLHRRRLLLQLGSTLTEDGIDEQEPELGLVARVEVVGKGAKWVQRGVTAAGQRRRDLRQPGL